MRRRSIVVAGFVSLSFWMLIMEVGSDMILNSVCGLRTSALVTWCVLLGFACCMDVTRRVIIWMSLSGLRNYIKQLMLTVESIFTMDHHSNM